jgi:hypothetical protein
LPSRINIEQEVIVVVATTKTTGGNPSRNKTIGIKGKMFSVTSTTVLPIHPKNAEIIPKTKSRKVISTLKSVFSNLKKKKMTKVFTSWKTLWKTQKKMTNGMLTLALHATCQVMQEFGRET